MDLILSGQVLRLSPHLRRGQPVHGLTVLKNERAKTYLRVTTPQWVILQLFAEPRTVPDALDHAIRERVCLPLGEFFELVLKARRAHVLLDPGASEPERAVCVWRLRLPPAALGRPLAVLLVAGVALVFVFPPVLPRSVVAVLAGLAILSAALTLGAALAAALLCGAGGEVFRPRWGWVPPALRIGTEDEIMLPLKLREAVFIARPAVLAMAAGLTAWRWPAWSLLPALGLAAGLRPVFGGRFARLLHRRGEREASDAEHAFLFPPNRTLRRRARLLGRVLRQGNTWIRLGYAMAWTLGVCSFETRLMDRPPWTPAFWEREGDRLLLAATGSLGVMAAGYIGWETLRWARRHAGAAWTAGRRAGMRWLDRWRPPLSAPERLAAVEASPLFSLLAPEARRELALAFRESRHPAWLRLSAFQETPAQVGLIVSGTVSLRRPRSSWGTVGLQVLAEGDVVGLHDLADPLHPRYRLRTRTPVRLLQVGRPIAERLLAAGPPRGRLADTVLKLPFLRRTALCRSWTDAAVARFAQLSGISDYPGGRVIFSAGQPVSEFFVIFEGAARVERKSWRASGVRAGEFFGEIGLLQNSAATASIRSLRGTRCLTIARGEFLKFATCDPAVALELERVSSRRLGHPIFPLKSGDFRAI